MGSYRLVWQPLGGGQLAIGHKPGAKLSDALVRGGCTLRVSLLSLEESAREPSEGVYRLPLQGAKPPAASRDSEVIDAFDHIDVELSRGGRVYIHCSAGLHRTGMFTFALLRHRGLAREEAVVLVRAMRELTADELTEERMLWGERFGRDLNI